MKWGAIVFILLVFPLALAQEYSVTTSDNEALGNMHATVEFDTGEKTLVFVQDGIMKVDAPSAASSMKIKFDSLSTLGTDYFIELPLPSEQVITVLPVGSVFGFVYDEEGKALPKATLEAVCGAQYGEFKKQVSDEFGAFSFDALPVGACTLRAIHDNKVGSASIDINQGGLIEDASVVLDKSRVTQNLWWVAGLFLALLIISAAWFFGKAKEENASGMKKTTRLDTILPTLNEKEQRIVAFLVEHGETYQNKLVHELHIPKTTLVRVFTSLESKKVILVEKIGKTKKVSLTDWIKSSEEAKD